MSGLGQTAREYLREAGCERAYADGAVVVRRGEPGGAFYVVVSGAVDVLLVADDGRRLPLARLGEGSSFGEMSLLTGEAVSADVVARGGATLLVYPWPNVPSCGATSSFASARTFTGRARRRGTCSSGPRRCGRWFTRRSRPGPSSPNRPGYAACPSGSPSWPRGRRPSCSRARRARASALPPGSSTRTPATRTPR